MPQLRVVMCHRESCIDNIEKWRTLNPRCVVECYNDMHNWFHEYYPRGILYMFMLSREMQISYFSVCMMSIQGGLYIDCSVEAFELPSFIYDRSKQCAHTCVNGEFDIMFSPGNSVLFRAVRSVMENNIKHAERLARFRPFDTPCASELISPVILQKFKKLWEFSMATHCVKYIKKNIDTEESTIHPTVYLNIT